MWFSPSVGGRPNRNTIFFMPNFHLSDREIEALSSFLHTLQGQHNDAGRQEEALFQFFLGGGAKQRGQFVFERFACWSCHGEGGHGGIKNPNAYTEEEEYIGEVPPLDEVTNLLEPDEIREIVINGAIPEKNDSDGQTPPYACPEWGDSITEDELNDMEGGILRTFHERWQENYKPEDLIDEDGKPKRDRWGNLLEVKRYKGKVLHEDEEFLDEEQTNLYYE